MKRLNATVNEYWGLFFCRMYIIVLLDKSFREHFLLDLLFKSHVEAKCV